MRKVETSCVIGCSAFLPIELLEAHGGRKNEQYAIRQHNQDSPALHGGLIAKVGLNELAHSLALYLRGEPASRWMHVLRASKGNGVPNPRRHW